MIKKKRGSVHYIAIVAIVAVVAIIFLVLFSMGFFTPTEISDQELDAVLSELSDEELEMLESEEGALVGQAKFSKQSRFQKISQVNRERLKKGILKVRSIRTVKTDKSYKTLIPVKLKTSDNYLNFKKAYSNMGYDFSDKEMFDIMKYSYFINRNKGLSSPIISNLFYQNIFIISGKDVLSRKDSNSVRNLINSYLIYEDITALNKDAYLTIAGAIIKQTYGLYGMVNWQDGVQMIVNVGPSIDKNKQNSEGDPIKKTRGVPVTSQGEPIISNTIDVGTALGNMFAACAKSGGKGGFGGSPQGPGDSFSPVGTTTTEGSNVKLGETGMGPTDNQIPSPFEDCKLSPLRTKGSVGDPDTTDDTTDDDLSPWGGGGTDDQGPPALDDDGTDDDGTDDDGTDDDDADADVDDDGDGSGTNADPVPPAEGGPSLPVGLTASTNPLGGGSVTYNPDGGDYGIFGQGSIGGGLGYFAAIGLSFGWFPDPSSSSGVGAQVDQCKEMTCFFLETFSPEVEKFQEHLDCINNVITGDDDISPESLPTQDFSNLCGDLSLKDMKGPYDEAFTDPSPIQGQVVYIFNPDFQEESQN